MKEEYVSIDSILLRMRLLLSYIFAMAMVKPGKAQNLVPNPSFEIFTSCPTTVGTGGPMLCTPWVAVTNTADYFHVCGGFLIGVPLNIQGFQAARTGSAYTGVYTKITGGQQQAREYIQAQLLEPLEAGLCYEVGCWISLAEAACGINRFGILLSNGPEPNPFQLIPQVDAGGMFFTDNVNWQYISGYVQAIGGEDHITIGNFYNDADTDFYPPCNSSVVISYYYIEDVSVEISDIQEIILELDDEVTACDSYVIDPGNTAYTYVWSDGSQGQTLTVDESGTYSVTATYGCLTAEAEIEITILTDVTVDAGPPQLDLCTGDTYTISLDPTQGIYTWQDGTTGPEYVIEMGGLYEVTLDNGCYTATDVITINSINAPLPFMLGEDNFFCEGESIEFDLDPTLGNFLWQDGSTLPFYTITAAGAYALTISNPCGEQSDMIEISVVIPPEIQLGPDTMSFCTGEFIEFNLDPDIAEYLWDDESTDPFYIITDPGYYSVTASNACGVDSDFLVVTGIDPPVFNLGADTLICAGDTLSLDAGNVEGNFTWQDGSTSSSFIITDAGTYTLTITNECGTAADTVGVTFLPNLQLPNLGPDITICPGQLVILETGVQLANIRWSDMSTADTLLIDSPGTYYVDVYTACNLFSDTINVYVSNVPPVLQLPEDFALCQGDSIILNAGIIGVSYLWSDGSILPDITVYSPGQYAVTISNLCGTSIDTVVINPGVAAPFLSLGPDTSVCEGDTFVIIPVAANVDAWLWSDGSVTSQYVVVTPGLITATVSNSCASVIDTILISTLSPIPALDLGPDTALCNGTALSLTIDIPDVNILWFDGTTAMDLIISDSAEVFASITNACGQTSDTLDVSIIPLLPALDLGPDQNICPGESIILSPGINDVTYLWHDGSTLNQFETSIEGIISLTISGDCEMRTDTIILTESTEGPQLDLGPHISACEGETIILQAGISGVQYLWSNGSLENQISVTQNGNFSLTVSNACGTDSDTTIVTFEILPPGQSLGQDTILCDNDTLVLNAVVSPGIALQWQNLSSLDYYVVTTSGQYSITGTNLCGVETDTIEIIYVNTPATFSLGPDTILCSGEELFLTAPSTADMLLWQDGSNQPDYIASEDGAYVLTIANECGSSSDSLTLAIDTNTVVVQLSPQYVLCPGDILELDATQIFAATYQWNTGAISPIIVVSDVGQYSVQVISDCGQSSGQTVVLPDEDCNPDPEFFVPNIFTPDGDGINDVFTLTTNVPEAVISVGAQIFDRWGNQVFESEDNLARWDGTFNGEDVGSGVFAYIIRVRFIKEGDEQIEIIKGDVTLLR